MQSSEFSPIIRQAAVEDAAEMAILLGQLGYPTDPASVDRRLQTLLPREDYRLTVAEGKGGLLGLICVCWGFLLEYDGRWGQITALVVEALSRGQGIGTRLLEEGEAWLRSREVERIIVNSRQQRTAAHHFYRRRGFELTGFRFQKMLAVLNDNTHQAQNNGPSEASREWVPALTRHLPG